MNPWIWAIGAVVVALLELHAPGCYLIWVALGGAVTAIAAFTAVPGLTGQLVLFAAASLVSCVIGYFVYRRVMAADPDAEPINSKQHALIGMRGAVDVALANGAGKVRLGDSVWLAEGPDLPVGAAVVVTAVRGTTVIVATPS